MQGNVNVNAENVERHVSNLKGVATYFKVHSLFPYDGMSTIKANGRGQIAYHKAQEVLSVMGACLEQEASNIRGLGVKFEEYDEMLSLLWDSGSRYSSIEAPEGW